MAYARLTYYERPKADGMEVGMERRGTNEFTDHPGKSAAQQALSISRCPTATGWRTTRLGVRLRPAQPRDQVGARLPLAR